MARTVLIVDDHAEFRRSARALLESEGLLVVGDVATAADALAVAARVRPDAVLLDIQLPDHDGFWVARELAASAAPPKVVLVSGRAAVAFGDRLQDAPVRGYIAKSDLTGAGFMALLE